MTHENQQVLPTFFMPTGHVPSRSRSCGLSGSTNQRSVRLRFSPDLCSCKLCSRTRLMSCSSLLTCPPKMLFPGWSRRLSAIAAWSSFSDVSESFVKSITAASSELNNNYCCCFKPVLDFAIIKLTKVVFSSGGFTTSTFFWRIHRHNL